MQVGIASSLSTSILVCYTVLSAYVVASKIGVIIGAQPLREQISSATFDQARSRFRHETHGLPPRRSRSAEAARLEPHLISFHHAAGGEIEGFLPTPHTSSNATTYRFSPVLDVEGALQVPVEVGGYLLTELFDGVQTVLGTSAVRSSTEAVLRLGHLVPVMTRGDYKPAMSTD